MQLRHYHYLALFIITFFKVNCQTTTGTSKFIPSGPVIEGYGGTFSVDSPDLTVNGSDQMKVVFDISTIESKNENVNALIETAARFLNLHARNGLPVQNMKVALIIHGNASKDVLNNESYMKRYGIENPHKELIEKLDQAGVDIYLCGQTAGSRGIERKDILPEIKLALSAMTALVKLQNEHYQLINFN